MKYLLCTFLVLLCLPAFAAENDKEKQWYSVSNETGECFQNQSPAHIIKIQKNLDEPYRVIDEKVINGKPVIVRVELLSKNWQIQFFRTKELCNSALAETKKKNSAELNRYK